MNGEHPIDPNWESSVTDAIFSDRRFSAYHGRQQDDLKGDTAQDEPATPSLEAFMADVEHLLEEPAPEGGRERSEIHSIIGISSLDSRTLPVPLPQTFLRPSQQLSEDDQAIRVRRVLWGSGKNLPRRLVRLRAWFWPTILVTSGLVVVLQTIGQHKSVGAAARPNHALLLNNSIATPPSTRSVVPKPSHGIGKGDSTGVVSAVTQVRRSAVQQRASKVDLGEGNGHVLINGVQYSAVSDHTNVIIELGTPVKYEVHRLSNPDRIYFDLANAHLASNLEEHAFNTADRLLARVRMAQFGSSTTRITLQTRKYCDYSDAVVANPYRLIVQLRPPSSP